MNTKEYKLKNWLKQIKKTKESGNSYIRFLHDGTNNSDYAIKQLKNFGYNVLYNSKVINRNETNALFYWLNEKLGNDCNLIDVTWND